MPTRRIIYAVLLLGGGLAAFLFATRADPDRSPAAQEAAARTIADHALATLKSRYPDGETETVRRDAHAKAHGCAKAQFAVDSNLPPDLRVGTFAPPGRVYKTWVRFSNGAFEPGPDTGMDGRGMAIKLLETDGPPSQHDILMINYPVFFSPDAVDYLDFAKAGALDGNSDGLMRYFLRGWNPFNWRIRQGLIAYRIASQPVTSPLSIRYFSMTPYAFGKDRLVKYVATPCQTRPAAATQDKGPDFLREELARGLLLGEACFNIAGQVRERLGTPDDATEEWSLEQYPPKPLGRLTLSRQHIETPGRDSFCEASSFNPWRSPVDLLPQGAMNAVRKIVYDLISAYRTMRNGGSAAPDPLAAFNQQDPEP